MSRLWFFLLLGLAVAVFCQKTSNWKSQKKLRLRKAPTTPVSESNINYFGVMKENLPHFTEALRNILVPRTPGSPGSEAVRNFIVNELRNLEWDVEVDTFFDPNTIAGPQTFSNIIATLDPNAPRRLVLACHYDSKVEPRGFLGATDSAVPCSQMLNLAHTMHLDLAATKGRDVTLQFLFFDGEEAFQQWSSTDSIYGARNLAEKWSGLSFTHKGVSGNYLDRIDVFVLLDLLGAKDPTIFSLNRSTQNWYQRLSEIENSLTRLQIVGGSKIFAGPNNFPVEDDHIPFLRRGVDILHLIATPFPKVWHTLQDDASAVDLPTIEKLNKIFRIFVAEYLELP